MSLQLESAQERMMYPDDYESLVAMNQTEANKCKASGLVLYNGSCQRRGNSCNGGKGYLGQVAGNVGWGVCINYGTRPTASSCPSSCGQARAWYFPQQCLKCSPADIAKHKEICPAMCDNGNAGQNISKCGTCLMSTLRARGGGIAAPGKPPITSPGSRAPGGSADPNASPAGCQNCNPIDVGCQIGKQFCEFQHWLAKQAGGFAMPVMIGGGLVIVLLALKR